MKQFVTFSLDGKQFGIEILYVREFNQVSEVTQVEHAPEYVRGLINLRGQIVTIFDIGLRLGHEARYCDDTKFNIIIKTNNELAPIRAHEGRDDLKSSDDIAGFLIDSFSDVVEVENQQIESTPANIGEREKEFIAGVVKSDDLLFTVLDVSKILADDEDLQSELGENSRLAHA